MTEAEILQAFNRVERDTALQSNPRKITEHKDFIKVVGSGNVKAVAHILHKEFLDHRVRGTSTLALHEMLPKEPSLFPPVFRGHLSYFAAHLLFRAARAGHLD